MKQGCYTVKDLLHESVSNYMHFMAYYMKIEDNHTFKILLEDIKDFKEIVNKVIGLSESYVAECQEINNMAFKCLEHYRNNFEKNLKSFHIYTFLNQENIKSYSTIFKDEELMEFIEKCKRNQELYTFNSILVENSVGLFMVNEEKKVINIKRELLIKKIINF
jgi:hypothetical protein